MKQILSQPYRLNTSPAELTSTRVVGRLAGERPYGEWSPGPNSTSCGYFGCVGPETLPPYYVSGYSAAQSAGYSVPINAIRVGTGAAIDYVNPDGTVGRVWDWASWPLKVYCAQVGTANPHPEGGWGLDCSFSPPPRDVWFQFMAQLGVADLAAIQAANVAAAQGYAQNAGQNSNPGVNPSQYVPGGGSSGSTGGSTGNTATSSAGTLSFVTSRGGNQLRPGDTWTITVHGAPNQPVDVDGIHPDGTPARNTMGTTSSAGDFVLQGTIDSSAIGNWQEQWFVGGQSVGSINFTVTAAAPNSTGGGGVTPPLGGTITNTGGGGGGVDIGSLLSGDNGKYALLGVGLLLAMSFMGRR